MYCFAHLNICGSKARGSAPIKPGSLTAKQGDSASAGNQLCRGRSTSLNSGALSWITAQGSNRQVSVKFSDHDPCFEGTRTSHHAQDGSRRHSACIHETPSIIYHLAIRGQVRCPSAHTFLDWGVRLQLPHRSRYLHRKCMTVNTRRNDARGVEYQNTHKRTRLCSLQRHIIVIFDGVQSDAMPHAIKGCKPCRATL